jgi:hypothetical protein
MNSSVRVAVQIAALTAISYSVAVSGTSTEIKIAQPLTQSAGANVQADRPPLETVFRDRFNNEWTQAQEDELLAMALKKGASPERDLFNLVHTAQHESVSDELPRLTEGDVLKLPRRKA